MIYSVLIDSLSPPNVGTLLVSLMPYLQWLICSDTQLIFERINYFFKTSSDITALKQNSKGMGIFVKMGIDALNMYQVWYHSGKGNVSSWRAKILQIIYIPKVGGWSLEMPLLKAEINQYRNIDNNYILSNILISKHLCS